MLYLGHLLVGVLPLCRDAVGIFYTPTPPPAARAGRIRIKENILIRNNSDLLKVRDWLWNNLRENNSILLSLRKLIVESTDRPLNLSTHPKLAEEMDAGKTDKCLYKVLVSSLPYSAISFFSRHFWQQKKNERNY